MGFFDDVKKGFESLIKPKKQKKKTSPTMRTASSNVNMERRLQKAGVKPPPKKKSGNWFTKLMDVVDRPADFVRTGLTTYYKTGSRVKSAQAAKSAWKGKTHTSGKQLLEAAAKRGAPLAKWAVQTPRRKAVTGFAAEVLLDPTTYITGGTKRAAFDSGQLAKNIIREVSKETGRKISQQSAKRLAQNALKGQVPIGRLGTAINRAVGYQAEMKTLRTGFGKLTGIAQKAALKTEAQAKKARAAELTAKAGEMRKGILPKAGALPPGPPQPDFIAGYRAVARSAPPTVKMGGKEFTEKDLLKYQKSLQKQADQMLRGAAQSIRQGYEVAKESDLYRIIKARGGIAPSRSGLFAGEYKETVPLALKNRNGMPIDELADEMGMSVRELLDGLRARRTITRDDIYDEASRMLAGDPEYRKILQEIDQVEDHLADLWGKERTITSAVEPYVAGLSRTYPKVTNIEARELGRKMAEPVEAEAKGFAQAAKELEKQARQIKPKKGFALVSEVKGKPGYDKTTIRFMGQELADITPVVKPIRTALGAVIEASPTLTRVRDALGRVFQFNYTPIGIKGLERELVTGAKQRITQAAREIPYARTKAMRETLSQWRGVSRQAAEEAPYIIEETAGFASVAGKQAAEKASRLFDLDVERFAKEGIPLNVIDNYVMHLYTDPPEKVKAVIDKWRIMRRNIPEARPSFTRSRNIPTLEEAEQLGLNPIKDARQLTMVHRALTEQAVVLQQMGKDLLKMGRGIVRNHDPGGWVNVTHTAIPSLQGKWVHPEVAKALENLYPIISNTDEGMKTLSDFVDRATRAWKAVVLFRPGFHLRNFVGNIFLNIADGVGNPDRYSQALGVLTGVLPEIELAGKRVSSQVVRDWFEKEALKGQGMFREAMHGTTRQVTEEAAKMLQTLARGGFGKVAYYVRHPFEASREFGEATDSLGRMANFLHHLDEGLSPAEAAQRTRIALFDYGQLTPAEQQIRRWVMPFYAWTRFALPRMAERLVGAPGLFTGATHLRESMVSLNEVDEQNLPQWLADNQAIPLWVDPKGNVHYVTWNLPLTELMKIHDPRDIRGTVQEVFSMANPLITVPAQIALNKNVLGDMPITEFGELGGAPMYRDYARFAVSQLGMPSEIVKAQREAQARKEFEQAKAEGDLPEVEPPQKSWKERLLGMTTVQNPASWERQAIYQRNEQLKQAIKAAEQQGIEVPTTEEIGKPGGLTGFAKVATGGGYGKGFAGVAARSVAKEAGSTPDVIRQAMQITGVDPSWGPYLTMLMRAESGGNPVAVNPTWVEYSTGRTAPYRVGPGWYRATGLFQMMEPTFRAHAMQGHQDILNPLDNAIAAIRYIKGKYGHPANISRLGQPGYKGY